MTVQRSCPTPRSVGWASEERAPGFVQESGASGGKASAPLPLRTSVSPSGKRRRGPVQIFFFFGGGRDFLFSEYLGTCSKRSIKELPCTNSVLRALHELVH